MATLGELTRQHTQLNRDEVDHLQRLIGEWGLLADLSFADLLLYVPGTDGTWYVVAHVRPATGQTIYHYDYVGTAAAGQEVPLLSKAYTDGEIVEGELVVEGMPDPVRMMAVPVRDGEVGVGPNLHARVDEDVGMIAFQNRMKAAVRACHFHLMRIVSR